MARVPTRRSLLPLTYLAPYTIARNNGGIKGFLRKTNTLNLFIYKLLTALLHSITMVHRHSCPVVTSVAKYVATGTRVPRPLRH